MGKLESFVLKRINEELKAREIRKKEIGMEILGMNKSIERIRKKTGIDFHFHLLRHYFTTSLIEKGVDFITIAEILGHSKITMSLIYSHTDKERKKKAVDLLVSF